MASPTQSPISFVSLESKEATIYQSLATLKYIYRTMNTDRRNIHDFVCQLNALDGDIQRTLMLIQHKAEALKSQVLFNIPE